MSAEEAGLVRAWHEARQGPANYEQELLRVDRAGRRTSQTLDQGFGSQMLAKYASAAGAIGLITAGIHKAAEAWTNYIKLQKEALETQRNVDQSSRKLSQIAGGDPAKIEQLHRKRDELAVKYSVDRDAVADAIFNAESAGLSDKELEATLEGTQIGDDAGAATKYMGAVKQIYKGKVDPRAAYNVGLQAAADAPNLEMKDVTGGMPELLNPANVLGLGVEESAAIMSETAAHYPGGAETTTAMKRLLSKLSMDKRFQGKGLEGVEKFSNMSEEGWKDVIGEDSEPRAAARALKAEIADIKASSERYKQIASQTGGDEDLLTKNVGAHRQVQANRDALELKSKELELEIDREREFAPTQADYEKKRLQGQIDATDQGFVGSATVTSYQTLAGLANLDPDISKIGGMIPGSAADRRSRQAREEREAREGGNNQSLWDVVSRSRPGDNGSSGGDFGDEAIDSSGGDFNSEMVRTLKQIEANTKPKPGVERIAPPAAAAPGLEDR